MCAAYRLEKGQSLQAYTVPAGQGKSRIIAAILAALCSKSSKSKAKKYTHFHCIYNHQQLLDMDRGVIAEMADTNQL